MSLSPPSTKMKKSVRFDQTVHVAPFERVAPDIAKDVWYTRSEMIAFVAEGREMAVSYRKIGTPQTEDDSFYRGFEGCTIRRQRRRLLSNRCAVYAHKQGMDAETTAAMYTQSNEWSVEVAFVQAIHDFVDTHPDNDSARKNKMMMSSIIPSVASMIPPPDTPFAVEGFSILQSQKKSKLERKLKRRMATAGIRRVRQRVLC